MVGLGDLPGGSSFSSAQGVSADGLVVVGGGSTVLGSEAFIWDSANGMQNLQAVMEDQFGLNLTGWKLTYAFDVSADGLIIVGWGRNPEGNAEAWIATLPSAPECPADFIVDGFVNVTDLIELLGKWGPCPAPCTSDIDGNGNVNITDLIALLAAWGACP